ncbi:MAG TPA: L,D-transpeptidase [Gemmatimonadaceae bacterium]|nr:L,D-transpeptidase [Gemmatimonadaceae bacterium]
MRALAAATALAASISSAQSTPAFTSKNVEAKPARFPIQIPREGPVNLQLQILLDKAGFSPGIIDGAWGINAAKAMTFFTEPDDTKRLTGDSPPPVTTVDRATYDRLRIAARRKPLLRQYTVVRADLAGPFTTIPEDVYKQARLDCLCYSSPLEQLSERFHVSRKLLAKLNPRVNLEALRPGVKILVPNVELDGAAVPQDTAIIARVIISKKHYWTHAVDGNGKIIYHFPSTLGAGYDPSPSGDFKVTYVSRDPSFKYQPKLFAEVPDTNPEAKLPAGPNSPVGVVWISLSKQHYGIHGTSSPETIGYANSHGCVRLTNWDALRLSDLVEAGTPVQFR